MLDVRSLDKTYSGGRKIVEKISFHLAPHETVSIVGPSGCGKTTLLYMLCGLTTPDAGEVRLLGRKVTRPRHDIAIILQDYGLLPWKSVAENVALGLKLQGVGRKERMRAASRMLEEMGLAGREPDYPSCLSGGEQQRVAIARAYAVSPTLLLMDEPFSSLDALTREKLQDTLRSTWVSRQTPYVLVTHSVEEAIYLGRTILLLAGSPARVCARFANPHFGEPGLRDSPAFYGLLREVRKAMEEYW